MYESLLVFVIVNLLLLLAIKLYIKLTTGINNTYTCLIGKTVIITGGNSGKRKKKNSIILLFNN